MSAARPLVPAATASAAGTARPRALPSRLSPGEWQRRLLHMAPGLLPVVLWFVPHQVPLSPVLRGILLAAIVGLAGLVWSRWRAVRRAEDAGDAGRLPAVAGYAGGVLLTLFCFPDRPECGFAVLGVLAFGDGSATLFGKLTAGTSLHAQLPWNRAKSWAGLIAFLVCGTLAAAILYRGESLNAEALTPAASWGEALAIGLCGAVPAGLWESARSRLNDNIRVSLAAAVGVLIAHAIRVSGL